MQHGLVNMGVVATDDRALFQFVSIKIFEMVPKFYKI